MTKHNCIFLRFFADTNYLTCRNPGYLSPIQSKPWGFTFSSRLTWEPQYSLKTFLTVPVILSCYRDSRIPFNRRNFNCIILKSSWICLKSAGKFSIQASIRLQVLQNAFGLIGCTCQSQLPSNLIDYVIEKLDMLKFSLIEIAHYKLSSLNGNIKWMPL